MRPCNIDLSPSDVQTGAELSVMDISVNFRLSGYFVLNLQADTEQT